MGDSLPHAGTRHAPEHGTRSRNPAAVAARAFIGGILLSLSVARAQELVPNGSFETNSYIPQSYSQISLATGWGNATNGTVDYMHSMSTSMYADVPTNNFGFQFAHTGEAYAGFFAIQQGSSYHEYPQRMLASPLVANQRYYVQFWLSLADDCGVAVDRLGLFLSTSAVTRSDSAAIEVSPQIVSPAGVFLDSKTNWMRISGIFRANGGEQWLTIGNFRSD